MTIRRKYIRELVQKILQKNQIIAPPVLVTKVADGLGIEIRYEPAEEELSGFLLRDVKSNRAVIGVNTNHGENRKNFTIAHEIGHFLLHEGDVIHVDRANAGFRVKLRSDEASKGTNIDEIEANLFAAELLMPVAFLKKDLSEIGNLDVQDDKVEAALQEIAKKYRVSTQALIFRLINLGFIESHS
jgi:Zn-dependent peptidase ImmA (M78 family)